MPTKTKKGGRPTRAKRLRALSKQIAAVRDGSYLAELEREYRALDLREALSEARNLLGSGGVRMVEAMLQRAAGNAAALDRLREYLEAAGVKASVVERIVASTAAATPAGKPKRVRKADPAPQDEPSRLQPEDVDEGKDEPEPESEWTEEERSFFSATGIRPDHA